MRNFRLGLRILLQRPGFALTAILALGLGIGANTAIFSFVDALLLRPLPYPDASQLVAIEERGPGDALYDVSPANWMDWQARADLFDGFAAWGGGGAVLTDAGEPERLRSQRVSHEFLSLLRVRPHRGRLFRPEDDRPNAQPVVILSYGLWQRRFGGDEAAVGRTIQLNATACRVIGVMPPGFYLLARDIDFWEPFSLDRSRDWRANAGRFINVLARMKPGVTRDRAQAQMTAIMAQLERDHPKFNSTTTAKVVDFREVLAGKVETSLKILFGAVAALLLIGCFNVANLLLARTAARHREMAVRMALGAGRWGIVRQLLIENMALAMAGGILGVVSAYWIVSGLMTLAPKGLVAIDQAPIDMRVLAFTLAVSIASSLIFGLAPALTASRGAPAAAMREGGRTGTVRSGGLRRVFIGAQVALTLVLLSGAGLLVRSLQKLHSVDTGLDARSLITMNVSLPGARYREPQQRVQFFEQLLGRIRALPGVESASGGSSAPVAGQSAGTGVDIDGYPKSTMENMRESRIRSVMPGYFRTLKTRIVAGREFSSADLRSGAPISFIVNQAFVRTYLRGEDPLTKKLSVAMQRENPFGPIVGVVANSIEGSLDREPQPTVYYSYGRLTYSGLSLLVRTSNEALAAREVPRIVRELDRNQPVTDIRSMEQVLGETVARQRMNAVVLAAFAGSALLLAVIGIYGVLAYITSERTREVGVRMALGAQARHVVRLIVWQGMIPAVAGLGVGLAAALWLSRLIETQLFQVDSMDPLTFGGAATVLLAVAIAATWLPSMRAARVNPVVALRQD